MACYHLAYASMLLILLLTHTRSGRESKCAAVIASGGDGIARHSTNRQWTPEPHSLKAQVKYISNVTARFFQMSEHESRKPSAEDFTALHASIDESQRSIQDAMSRAPRDDERYPEWTRKVEEVLLKTLTADLGFNGDEADLLREMEQAFITHVPDRKIKDLLVPLLDEHEHCAKFVWRYISAYSTKSRVQRLRLLGVVKSLLHSVQWQDDLLSMPNVKDNIFHLLSPYDKEQCLSKLQPMDTLAAAEDFEVKWKGARVVNSSLGQDTDALRQDLGVILSSAL